MEKPEKERQQENTDETWDDRTCSRYRTGGLNSHPLPSGRASPPLLVTRQGEPMSARGSSSPKRRGVTLQPLKVTLRGEDRARRRRGAGGGQGQKGGGGSCRDRATAAPSGQGGRLTPRGDMKIRWPLVTHGETAFSGSRGARSSPGEGTATPGWDQICYRPGFSAFLNQQMLPRGQAGGSGRALLGPLLRWVGGDKMQGPRLAPSLRGAGLLPYRSRGEGEVPGSSQRGGFGGPPSPSVML